VKCMYKPGEVSVLCWSQPEVGADEQRVGRRWEHTTSSITAVLTVPTYIPYFWS